MSIADEIQKLHTLRESGALSDAEFEQAKSRLLNPSVAAPVVDSTKKLGRSRTDSMVGGGCGGLAIKTDMPAWVWRLIFAATFLFSFGSAGIIYLLLWWLMPYAD